MSGPTTGVPTLPDLKTAAAGGGYDSGQVVYVIDAAAFFKVLRVGADWQVTRLRYPNLPTFEEETDDQPNWTPGLIDATVEGGTPETVLVDPCQGVSALRALAPGIAMASYNLNGGDPKRPAPREEGDSFGPILDQTIFPNAASTGDPA